MQIMSTTSLGSHRHIANVWSVIPSAHHSITLTEELTASHVGETQCTAMAVSDGRERRYDMLRRFLAGPYSPSVECLTTMFQ